MTSSALKMVMVYSDKHSAELGEEVAQNLCKCLSSNFVVDRSTWNSELLRSPKLCEIAAREALQSNVLIISTSEARTLPAELISWIEKWRDQRPEGPAALVALLNKNELVCHAEDRVGPCLRQTARKAHMDFFCHTEGGGAEDEKTSKAKASTDRVTYSDPSGKFQIGFFFDQSR